MPGDDRPAQPPARRVDGMAGGSSDSDARDGIPGDARSGVRAEIQTFLTTRRARISPEQPSLPAYGGERRPGLGPAP
jgi:hypothetical protein